MQHDKENRNYKCHSDVLFRNLWIFMVIYLYFSWFLTILLKQRQEAQQGSLSKPITGEVRYFHGSSFLTQAQMSTSFPCLRQSEDIFMSVTKHL